LKPKRLKGIEDLQTNLTDDIRIGKTTSSEIDLSKTVEARKEADQVVWSACSLQALREDQILS